MNGALPRTPDAAALAAPELMTTAAARIIERILPTDVFRGVPYVSSLAKVVASHQVDFLPTF
jgi:phytoene/squalene synthetase